MSINDPVVVPGWVAALIAAATIVFCIWLCWL